MSIFHCNECDSLKDSDFVEYETIDGNDVCIFCLETGLEDPDGRYDICDHCDKWYDKDKHTECPRITCKLERGSSLMEGYNDDEDESEDELDD